MMQIVYLLKIKIYLIVPCMLRWYLLAEFIIVLSSVTSMAQGKLEGWSSPLPTADDPGVI